MFQKLVKLFQKDSRSQVLLLIVVTGLIRVFLSATTGLGVGESYYWRGAQYLDWSYFDQPPLFFWFSGLSIRLLGLTNLALRLPAILLFAGSSWLMFTLTRKLFNERAGFLATALFNISFVFTVPVASWFQPDAPLTFFWLLTVRLLTEIFFETKKEVKLGQWVLVGIALGLTTLSKYHALFLVASVLIFVLYYSNQRKWITHPGPYLSVGITALFLIPVIYWNAQHEWVSFNFQGSRVGGDGLDFSRLGRSLVGQIAWIAPWLWLPMILQLIHAGKRMKTDQAQGFLFWCATLPIVFFTAIALVSRIGFHFHWQAPGYMMIFPLLGNTVASRLANNHSLTLKWLRLSSGITTFFVVILLVHMTTGFWSFMGPKLVGEAFGTTSDPTIEGVDFEDVKDRFDSEGWLVDDNLFIATEKWWQTGKIDWPLKGKKDILIFHPDPRNHAYFFDPKPLLGKDAIYIRYHKDHGLISEHLLPFFDEVIPIDPIEIKRYGKTELVLDAFLCKNFQTPAAALNHLPLYRRLMGEEPF